MAALSLIAATVAGASAASTETAHPEEPTTVVLPGPTPGDEISQGLWWLYQLRYDNAYHTFQTYAAQHPRDPAGYFYMAATDWWHLAQDFDFKLPAIESRFEQDYRDAVRIGRKALDDARDAHERALACLYWGGAEGLRGRWLVTQKEYVKAYFLGKRGNHLLHRALHYDPTLYDAYMGLGIYDYFTDTLSGVVRALSSLLIHGDRARGLRELETAIQKSRHARVESMIFLIEIYTSEEDAPAKALPLAQQLRREFPYSPAMHLAEIMAYFGMRQWDDVAREAQVFLEKSEQEAPYYTKEGIRPARYCLGMAAFMGRHDLDDASWYFSQLLTSLDSSRWVTFAFLRRAQIEDIRGQREEALSDYKRVLDRMDFWGSHHEAEVGLSHPFQWPLDGQTQSGGARS